MINYKLLGALPVVFCVVLSGCATLSEGECKSVDWFNLGSEDANRGHDTGRLSNHMDACEQFGVTPDGAAYAAGHREGLKSFCTTERGLDYGRDGSFYRNTCSADMERDFLRGYEVGKEINDTESELDTLTKRINGYEKDLDDEEDDGKRKELRRKIDNADDDRRRLRRRLDDLERDARRLY